jgi:hypothetical protein
MRGKDCKKNKNKNEKTRNLENPKPYKKNAYTHAYPNP